MPGIAVEVHPAARLEMQAAYRWYFERNPTAAALLAEIDDAIRVIGEAPARLPPYLEGTRRFVLRRFPFSVVFRASTTSALVVAFAHGRRRPGYWHNR